MRIAIVDDIKEERAVLYGWLSNQLSKGIFLVISLSLNQEKNFWRQQKTPFYRSVFGYLYEWRKWN